MKVTWLYKGGNPLYNQLSMGGKLLYSHFFDGVILQYSNFSIGCVWKMARGKWHYTTRVLNNIKVLRLNQFLLKTHFSHQKKKELPVIEFFQYVSTVIVSIRHNYLQNWSVHFLTIFFIDMTSTYRTEPIFIQSLTLSGIRWLFY